MIICSQKANSQYVVLGQEAASLRWLQVKTAHFQLIFPEDFSSKAINMANQLEFAWVHDTKTLSCQPKFTHVVIHTHNVESNAISLIAPSRTEFYMTPPQNCYAHGWQEQLVVHEYRHMVQLAKLNQGLTKILSYPFGDYAHALTFGLFTPMWYMEGDAVVMETALSHSGRGRLPGFEMMMKTKLLEKGMLPFQMARLGSYKTYVPDQYSFGYYYIAMCRKNYGPGLWDKGMDQAARNIWKIAPLNLSLKQQSGFTKRTLYDTLFRELSCEFQKAQKTISLTSFSRIKIPKKTIYTNYKFPLYLNDTMIIAEKSGMDDIPSFVSINRRNGKEKTICYPGFYSSESLPTVSPLTILAKNSPGSFTTDNLSLDRGKICWAAKKYDPRWQFRNYSVVMTYDLSTGKKTQLTHQSHLFSPVLFPGKDSILAVEVISDSLCNLMIISSKDGSTLSRMSNPKKDFYMIPSISKDGSMIAVVTFNKDGKSIKLIRVQDGQERCIAGPTFDEISNPRWFRNYIVYNAAMSGVDNIYAADTATQKKYQVTSASYGAYQPDFSENLELMAYSQFTADGFELVETKIDPNRWIPVDSISYQGISLYKSYLQQEDGILDREHTPTAAYEIKPYRKALHLLSPHSWAPASFSLGEHGIQPGISFASQNMLSTSILNAGYAYMPHEKSGYFFVGYTYSGFYPVFDLNVITSNREVFVPENTHNRTIKWRENSSSLGVRLPLISTSGSFLQKWELSLSWNHLQLRDYPEITNNQSPNFNVIRPSFSFSNLRKSCLRDMATAWGQTLNLNYYLSTDNKIIGEISGNADLYFPGLLKHHSIKISFDALKREHGSYPFKENVRFPRGYLSYYHDQYWRTGADYKFPFLYPDLSLGSILYLKRLKLDIFYDYAEGNNEQNTKTYRSFGYELNSDLHLLGFFIPIDVGFRHSYLPREKESHFDILLSISFEGL
ncbi:MAG: hypothetical protein WCO63_07545 [Bacteroidota bacterium]